MQLRTIQQEDRSIPKNPSKEAIIEPIWIVSVSSISEVELLDMEADVILKEQIREAINSIDVRLSRQNFA